MCTLVLTRESCKVIVDLVVVQIETYRDMVNNSKSIEERKKYQKELDKYFNLSVEIVKQMG